MKPPNPDLVSVLRKHALLLSGNIIEVDRKDTAKLLNKAAKAIEALRLLKWGSCNGKK